MIKSKQQQGFTLVELLTIVSIIAILACIALPSYQNYVQKTRKEAVRADLIDNVRKLESYYNRNKSFTNFDSIAQNKSKNFFTIAGIYGDNDYRLTATPTDKNKGESQIIIYDSVDGMVSCDKTEANGSNTLDCNPF
jgi:type IV pilus assembly protein PilE